MEKISNELVRSWPSELAKLAGYEINTVDIHGVLWVYPKKDGDHMSSFKYIPDENLHLLMECVRSMPRVKGVNIDYYKGDVFCVRCVITAWKEKDNDSLDDHLGKGNTEEEALYAALCEYLGRIQVS